MAPSPPGRSAGSRRIGARVSKSHSGAAWPLDLSPFRWFTATVDQSLRWGMAVLPRGVKFRKSEKRRAKPQLTPLRRRKEAEAATASFPFFYVDFGPVRLPQRQSARLMPSLRGAGARREDRTGPHRLRCTRGRVWSARFRVSRFRTFDFPVRAWGETRQFAEPTTLDERPKRYSAGVFGAGHDPRRKTLTWVSRCRRPSISGVAGGG